ncbi:tumor necrosis factor alpha-induced protein 2 [Erinaceus europaeus]|uniref:Tumor necrosis factor alpha-induced protein 2 n=1 Tax=Erinaceus europaeus TaxID=9365 RepID=A0ABM3WKJ2_ERIEU|nr:tumor necrosis factor alpha-induced protein 2 [Erinaceus europaeus]XP_060037063.1 tumor necrosis factor alpha-induced protein 2 [Erinaceus europaeus]XP_060037064.1 tumor necrosis factor alpha-induced protein 2 [Erinaceus europaeus]
MLKMMTFQGLPGQQTATHILHLPRDPQSQLSTSEAKASMWEEPSRDPVVPLEVEVAPERNEEAARKKEKKKPRGLANMFSVFTKGRKKKEQEGEPAPLLGQGGQMPTVEELKAALEQGRLEAAGPLLALERELVALAASGSADAEELVRRQSKVEALYVLLRGLVLGLLGRPLLAAPERLRQALAVLAEQEREDAAQGPGPASLEATRPRGWLRQWRDEVARAADERLGGAPDGADDPGAGSQAERAFLHMGCTMKNDLEAVVERLKPLFPAEMDVVAVYARSYHAHFAAQLASMAQFELCPRDTYMLLLWVQKLYPDDIINSPKLAGELQGLELGSLLPPKQVQELEVTFLSNEVTGVKELMARALELESERWAQNTAPQFLDSHWHSELAIDIMQILYQAHTKARNVTPDLGSQIRPMLLAALTAFLNSYLSTFDNFLEKGRQLSNYRPNVMANVNNCQLFWTTVEQKWQQTQASQNFMLSPLRDLKSHSFAILLQSLFEDLKPLFKKAQARWSAPEQLDEILATVGGRLPEFSGLRDCFREELMEAVHLHLVKEYITLLGRRRLVLKAVEQQLQLAGQIEANANLIQSFCTQHGSPASWLNPAIPTIAEIIRLQDPNAIKISVATYATWYPDFSKGHLNTILAIKGNLPSSEARDIRSILDMSTGTREPTKALFSLIKVG